LLTLELWYDALASEFGVIIATNDPERAKAKLYSLRASCLDKDLEALSILTSPTNPAGELGIVKRKTDSNAKN